MGDVFFDLFGDPVSTEPRKPGRPPHDPTDASRLKVKLLLALDMTEDEVAAGIGITAKTLRRHYSRELKVRGDQRLRLEAGILATLASEAAQGKVAAIKELDRQIEKHDRARIAKSVANRPSQAAAERISPPGKKEMARQAAMGVTGKFAPPPPPQGTLMN